MKYYCSENLNSPLLKDLFESVEDYYITENYDKDKLWQKKELRDIRKKMIDEMEKRLTEWQKPEDRFFYYHSSEDRIVLSHALFWVMTQNVKGHMAKEKYFKLLSQYQEEMLSAYLTESEEFPELLRYCNVMYEMLPLVLKGIHDLRIDKDVRKLSAITIVVGGYGGDMPEDLCNELLDDMDFYYNKVKCRKIERMLPQLNKMVEDEMNHLR